jgi:hypothetical protein
MDNTPFAKRLPMPCLMCRINCATSITSAKRRSQWLKLIDMRRKNSKNRYAGFVPLNEPWRSAVMKRPKWSVDTVWPCAVPLPTMGNRLWMLAPTAPA